MSIDNVRIFRNAFDGRVPYNLIVFDWYLKEWLETLDLSQADLGRLTDYPKAKVSDLVTGKQRFNRDILNDIATALHLQIHELLMPPEEAMAQRQMKQAMAKFVPVTHGGVAVDLDDMKRRVRKAS